MVRIDQPGDKKALGSDTDPLEEAAVALVSVFLAAAAAGDPLPTIIYIFWLAGRPSCDQSQWWLS